MSTSAPATNRLGLTRADYVGAKSTLCTGCGHDSVTNHLISALYASGVNPHHVAKLSGIGCSSKTPAYFLSKSLGFNSLHGRMAPVATGAKVANHRLTAIGVSGDGDTASIGMGGFVHLLRRNLGMVYLVENNGVYGLTKGQFSATADKNSKLKTGADNLFKSIDLCLLALDLGCSFVARSFSGDSKQLVPLLQAALQHDGTAFIDVISPCVTFNNHDGSTLSYDYVREHNQAMQMLDFIPALQEKTVDYAEGEVQTVEMHDGSILILRKLDTQTHNVHDVREAQKRLSDARDSGEILTGLFYLDQERKSLNQQLNLCATPLAQLNEHDTRPQGVLTKIMAEFR